MPGVRLNLSKSGISTSIGGRGATLNLSKRGARATVGLPGTGLSYSTRLGRKARTSTRGVADMPAIDGLPDDGIVLEEIEYRTGSGAMATKRWQVYLGIGERKSDGVTCLAIAAPGSSRRHNIEVGEVVSVAIAGERYHPDVPPERWRLRAQELTCFIEGAFSEDWATEYFDPASPKFYRAEGVPQLIVEGPAKRRRSGFGALLVVLVVILVVAIAIGETSSADEQPKVAGATVPAYGSEKAAAAVAEEDRPAAVDRDTPAMVDAPPPSPRSVAEVPAIVAPVAGSETTDRLDPDEVAADRVTDEVNAQRNAAAVAAPEPGDEDGPRND